MKFTVDRATWWRGKMSESYLLRHDGNKCCIGFCAIQGGATEDMILERYAIGSQAGKPALCDTLRGSGLVEPGKGESPWISEAYDLNDAYGITEDERESQLIALFARQGHEIEFIGEGNPAKAVTT